MKKLLNAFLALLLAASPAMAQTGQLGAGQVWGNSTAVRAPASPATMTAMFDRAFSSTRGVMLTRQTSAWAALAPGTVGLPLVSGGAGADLAYAVLGLAGGGTAAALTASNGGVVYSTASALAVLAGTATAGQILRSGSSSAPSWSTATWPATTAAGTVNASSSANVVAATATPTLGVAGTTLGTIALAGNTSGAATITPQAAAGSPTLTLPNASGTFAVSASAPLALSATTGALTITGAAGQVLGGSGPAFTATPTLGANGGTGGQITLAGSTSGSAVIRVAAAAGTVTFQLPATNGASTNVLSTDGAGVLSWVAAGAGTVTSVAAGTGMSFTTITGTGSVAADVATAANIRAGTANKMVDASSMFGAAALVALTDAANIATDLATGLNFSVMLAGNRTLDNPTNSTKVGQTGCIFITQDGTGTRTLAYGTNWHFAGGGDPTLTTTAAAVDMLCYIVRTSTSIVASLTKDVK